MKKIVWFLLAGLLWSGSLEGQAEEASRKGKFFLVPELGLQFGTLTYIEVAPQLGYHITDRLAIGTGFHYNYYKRNSTPLSPQSFSTHMYGIRAFSRFYLMVNAEQYLPVDLFSDLFAHLEYEALNAERRYFDAPGFPNEGRFWMNHLFVGGGITQRMGRFSSLTIMALWNLNEGIASPYSNPLIRVGINLYL